MKTQNKFSSRGFTLVELLVAMAITTIIVTILVTITSISLDAWNRSRSEIRAARQAEALINSLSRDLESLVIRKGNSYQWLYAESDPEDAGPRTVRSPNSANLIFLSAATDRYNGEIGTSADLGGDVSAIGYQLVYQDPIDPSSSDANLKTFVLYRKLVNPDETFTDILATPEDTSSSDTLKSVFPITEITDEENFICENIYQFTVNFQLEVEDASLETTSVFKNVSVPLGQNAGSSTDEFIITGSENETDFSNVNATNEQIRAGRLTGIEVSVTVLTDFGLKQMQRRGFSSDDELAEFISKNSYQYSKLIPVTGG